METGNEDVKPGVAKVKAEEGDLAAADSAAVVRTRKRSRASTSGPNKSNKPSLLVEHQGRLCRLLGAFVEDQNWGDAAGALSVLLQAKSNGFYSRSPWEIRKVFLSAIELLNRCEGGQNSSNKVKQICDVWMSRLTRTKQCQKERQLVQLELALLFLIQGNNSEAHYTLKFLLQHPNTAKEPKVHLLYGLSSYQLWYSELPEEIQLKENGIHVPLEIVRSTFNNTLHQEDKSLERLDCTASEPQERELYATQNEPGSSVNNQEKTAVLYKHPKKESHEFFHVDGSYMKHSADISIPNNEDIKVKMNLRDASIFSSHDLDTSLLPVRLVQFREGIKLGAYSHVKLLNGHYTDAVSHLRIALFSQPPLIAALVPLVQLLLLGNQVGEALKDLKKLCELTSATLPFSLRARLLEAFCGKQFAEISVCHEAVLMNNPTCKYSLEKLIKMSKTGNYCSTNLLEMIALHLDAASGDCTIWSELASCLLTIQHAQLSECEKDNMSANESGQHLIQSCSISFPFLKKGGRRLWMLRCRWWSKRHFTRKTYLIETQNGSWHLLTFKAACASHLYGMDSEYVRDVLGALTIIKDVGNLSLLQKHTENSLKLCELLPRLIE